MKDPHAKDCGIRTRGICDCGYLWKLERPQGRKGDWMQTATGRQFWPMDPRPEEVHIDDIVHSLSMMCRYAGHCRRFYSVAEHSVHVSRHVSPGNRLWALLHDASEAYLVDVPRPVKPYLEGYREIEAKVMEAICRRFDLFPVMPSEVHHADNAILNDEREQNMMPAPAPWGIDPKPLGVELQFWTPVEARRQFLFALESILNEEIYA